jgi:hypothetical protein
LDLLVVSVTVTYMVLQTLSLWLLKGGWRLAAWVPAATMAVAIVVGVVGGLAGSNIAPMWIVLSMPGCIGWLVVLLGAWGAAQAFGSS